MEFVGEVVAKGLGLTDSKYQYVIDAMEYDKWKEEQARKEEKEREEYHRQLQEQKDNETIRQESVQLENLEGGNAEPTEQKTDSGKEGEEVAAVVK